jgi:diguanylate cyclase (GGDEF)-like protein/PAS domain S-box-containing protein
VITTLARVRALLPRGGALAEDAWLARHRTILTVLWLHVIGVPIFGLIRGNGPLHLVVEVAPILAIAVAAAQRRILSPRIQSVLAALGLLTSSAVLVHLSNGVIEMHFHFFVMIGLIAMYQDWLPFLAAIGMVAAHHAIIGILEPHGVFNHPAAWNSPWKWAGIHALFVLGASAAQVTSWRVVEDQHERAAEVVRASERRFRALIENASDAVTVMDAEGSILYESTSVERVLGHRLADRKGESAFSFIHPDDIARSEAVLMTVLGSPGRTVPLDVRGLHADGTWRWIEAQITNLIDQPDVGGIVANFRDVTERRELEARLSHQAFHDSLTGLANRALFLDRTDHALASLRRLGAGHLAVLFLDLDDFKTINDGLGHAAGDAVLTELASRLRDTVRTVDTCARLGGDEFAILLEALLTPEEAFEIGARVLETVREPITVDGNVLSLNASLGIVVTDGVDDAADLVRNADLAMYKAKAGGKGRYEIFERGMHEAVVERLAMKADLRRAIRHDELVPYYQPIVELNGGIVVGAEALVRWRHPERGVLAPAAFIGLAEETGLIVPLGRMILRRACLDAASWAPVDNRLPSVSVNLSARQVQDGDIVADVAAALAESGLSPSRLTLEVTESILMADPDAAAAKLAQLKQLGITLALDDFGTGYSSLSYLERFPVDALKIDKSFIDGLAAIEAGDTGLVGAIVGLGERLRLHVTAEGIERPEQVRELVGLGCGLGQGFHFARPMPNEELAELFGRPLAQPPSS